jgi:hypothetical protein
MLVFSEIPKRGSWAASNAKRTAKAHIYIRPVHQNVLPRPHFKAKWCRACVDKQSAVGISRDVPQRARELVLSRVQRYKSHGNVLTADTRIGMYDIIEMTIWVLGEKYRCLGILR